MIIKIGIMESEAFQQYMIDIAAGRIRPPSDSPKIWFSSMDSLGKVLSDKNRLLLKIIADEKPETIQELADLSGRKPSNLSRTLKTFESYGFVELVKNARSKKPIAKATEFNIQTYA
ncbi:MAG TPA: MarR family transcriptional regulator [Gammaproteobacteria bacterium]|nr:MarR family transcriptional regulator [Gammaproteobacteria bacterium]